MRFNETLLLLSTLMFVLYFGCQKATAKPLRPLQQFTELEEYLNKNIDTQGYLNPPRTPRNAEDWTNSFSYQPYRPYRGKKNRVSAGELLSHLFSMVRDRGDPSGQIKALRFGISKR